MIIVQGLKGKKNDERIWNNLLITWHNYRTANFNSSENVKGETMRPIDADALLDFLDVGHLRSPTEICFSELMMKNIIDIQPTIDAVPVIWCSECKFVGTDATCCLVCKREGMGLRPFHVYPDDYCSYAERKDNG